MTTFGTVELNPVTYILIGKELCKKYPELAKELMKLIPEPLQTDINLIPGYYEHYQTISEIPQTDAQIRDSKLLFIAVMCKIFQPQIFLPDIPVDRLNRSGLAKQLSQELNIKRANISTDIRTIITWMEVYDEFREKVNSVVEILMEKK